MRARCLRISCASRHDRSVRSARLVGQASLGSRRYRRLGARVRRAVDRRELPRRPGRRAVPRLPRCHDRPRQAPRPPAPDGPGGGSFREHVAEGGGSAARSLLLSSGEYHRTGDISPVRGFKSPLGHLGVEVPRDTSPGIRWVPASKATPPRASASRSSRGQCGHIDVARMSSRSPRYSPAQPTRPGQ